jgi:hypothetical protein
MPHRLHIGGLFFFQLTPDIIASIIPALGILGVCFQLLWVFIVRVFI